MSVAASCPFCLRLSTGDVFCENRLSVAFEDSFPVSPGHALVVPRRHVPDFFELTADEQRLVWELVAEARRRIADRLRPAGFNVGANVGAAAGQTVWHAHVHVIPRYDGDVDDPRGGVRWVVPSKAAYWGGKR